MSTDDPHRSIRRVIEQYFSAIDARDWKRLRECFTPDVRFVAGANAISGSGGTDHDGVDAVLRFIRSVEVFEGSVHVIANIDVQCQTTGIARTTTFAVAHLVDGRDPYSRQIRTRGLRYTDEFVLVDGDWRIGRRVHQPLWQTAAPAEVLVAVPSKASL